MSDQFVELYCANHPNTPTSLRCNRCEKPICPKCAILTPTGYRCKECVRGQQKTFETALAIDYVIIFLVAGVMALLGSLLAHRLGFFIIFLAPVYGGIIGQAARFATGRRRSKRLYQLAVAAAVLGCLPMLINVITSLWIIAIVWEGVYVILMSSSLYYSLSGIRIG